MERAYTVKEMDKMRGLLETKFDFGRYVLGQIPEGGLMGRASDPEERTLFIEQRLRTHMLAGHTAEDLIKSEEVS